MANNTIPAPPVLAPLTLAPSNAAPIGLSTVQIYFWEILGAKWTSISDTRAWDEFPAGYYATAWSPQDGVLVPNAWGEHSTVIVVTSRTKPDGSAAPYVLETTSSNLSSPECPTGMVLTFPALFNPFGYHLQLCEFNAGNQSTNAHCPPGTVWDPVAEMCKAIVIPPFPPIPPTGEPPPPPPAPPLGQPDPYGDEITYDLCEQMRANTEAIIHQLKQLEHQQGDGGGETDACCAAVVTAITSVTNTLGLIFKQLSLLTGAPPPTVTVNAPVTVNVPTQPPPNITVDVPGTDVSQIVADLSEMILESELSDAAIDYLRAQGFVSPAMYSFLTRGRIQ